MITSPQRAGGTLVKAKLYKGPFSGRVYTTNGQNDITILGDKPMTRRQKFEWHAEQCRNNMPNFMGTQMFPQVEARYRIAMRPVNTSNGVVMAPAVHPDGSIFYEYVEGSKRERR